MASRRNRTTGIARGYRPPRARSERTIFGRHISPEAARLAFFGVLGLIVVLVVGIAIALLINVTVQRPAKTVLEVGESDVRLGYVARRLEALLKSQGDNAFLSAASAPNQMLSQIQSEELTIQGAASAGVLASMPEINNVIARQLGLPENQFDEAFADAVSNLRSTAGLQEADLLRQAQAIAVSQKVQREILKTPTIGAIVDLSVIATSTEAEALEAITRMGAGESLEDVAEGLSLRDVDSFSDTPAELLPAGLRDPVAAAEVGAVAGPVQVDRLYYVFRLNERLEDQAFTPDQQAELNDQDFTRWLQEQQTQFRIRRDFNSEDAQWALDQVDLG